MNFLGLLRSGVVCETIIIQDVCLQLVVVSMSNEYMLIEGLDVKVGVLVNTQGEHGLQVKTLNQHVVLENLQRKRKYTHLSAPVNHKFTFADINLGPHSFLFQAKVLQLSKLT